MGVSSIFSVTSPVFFRFTRHVDSRYAMTIDMRDLRNVEQRVVYEIFNSLQFYLEIMLFDSVVLQALESVIDRLYIFTINSSK